MDGGSIYHYQYVTVINYSQAKGARGVSRGGNWMYIRYAKGTYTGKDFLVDVLDVVALVEVTGVDFLTVGTGNAHGFYAAKLEINVQRLKEVNEVVSISLVLHRGTGIPFEVVRTCIQSSVAKVNVGTLLHATYLSQLKKELSQNLDGHNVLDVFVPVRAEIKKVVKEWIQVCNATNRY